MFSIAMVLWTFVFIFLISAIYYLRNVIKNGLKSHLLQFILACIAVIYGFVMLFNPIVAGNTIAKILAFFVIMNGISYILSSIIDVKIE